MTSKLDLSLDDIIKSRPKFNNNNRRREPQNNRNDRRTGGNSRQGPYGRGQAPPRAGNGPQADAGKILVNNLHFNVSEGDLKELFSQVGPVRTAALNFDSRGVSNGTGVVIFSRASDALTAMKKYNGVTLDGRAMRIAIPFTPDTSKPLNARVGPSNPVRESRGPSRSNRGSGGRNNRRRSSPRPTKTADDLDAELDAYNASSQAIASAVSSSAPQITSLVGEAMEE
ncbi:RNA-binding RNA annealing protein [Entomophthora muscae]|uniref:RNA-binding RNA annealing protein n=1 Tax=Entomophthora muscae TaxID=34485 RepID=A0ACC2SA31_9FUNG|nr:RNA-binding RNA annealing protein [Entomophthora muscae]